MDKVGYLTGQVEPLVARPEGLVLLIDIAGGAKNMREDYSFVLQEMLEGSLG